MVSSIVPTTSNRWPIAFVVAVAVLAMARAAGNDWSSYDDDLFLFRNPSYDPPTLASLAHYWTHGFRGLWSPVTHSTWWAIATISQIDNFEPGAVRLNPWTFHTFNVLVHCIASVLVLLLARRVVGSMWPAAFGAAVFAAHPVQAEAVAWTCGTKDLLAATFAMAAMLMATSTRGGTLRICAAVLLAALAMLSKASAVVLPAMIVVYAWLVERAFCDQDAPNRLHRRIWIVAGLSLAIAVPVMIVARRVQIVGDVPPVSLLARPIVALDAITMHLGHLLAPHRLIADYGFAPDELLTSGRRWWTWSVPLALTSFFWRSGDRIVAAGAALFALALLPNLGLAPFQFQVYSTVADRYAYPAMLGVAIVIARLLECFGATRHRPIAAIAVLLIVGGCILSWRQCATWANATSLWSHTLRYNPTSTLAHNNLGASLMAAGDLRGALAHFEIAADHPGSAHDFALLNLAQLHVRLGNADAAADAVVRLIESYRRRSDYDPQLGRQTVDRFVDYIGRIDPAAAESLRNRVR